MTKYLADNGGLQTLIQLIKDTFAAFDRNKQNKLRAGSNIIIDPATSTISATGGGGGSGSVDWGDISGTLTDQEDLAEALDGKADYNHTHSQSEVNGLADALEGKASTSHTHQQSDVVGLSNALAGKANTSHTHAQSDVNGLADALAGKASTSHTHQQSEVVGLSDALAGKANTSHTHAQSDVTGLTDALAGKASTIHSHGEITNAGTIENDTTPVKEDRPVFADSSDSNKVKKGTFEGFHKAMVSQLSEGTSDVSDGTEFLSSYSSESGFSDTNAVNRIYKRKFIKVWNYIQAKISSVLGLTAAQYNGNAATSTSATTATSATNDGAGNNIVNSLAGKASSTHAHGSITNGGAITSNTTPESADYPAFADDSDSGKLKRTSFQNFHKAMVSQMSDGTADVVDGTEFLSSYASANGFGDSSAPNQIFKRPFVKVWNYIQSKINSVLGLTAAQYNGNAATATSATNDSAGNNIASTYFPLAGRKAITGVYKDSPSLLHNIGFGNTSELGVWRKFCLIYTRATYRNAVGAIHIQGRQTLGTIYVRLNSSSTAPAEGNNTINPDVRYVSFVSNYNGIYYRVNEYNQLELWFKAHEYYDNISVTDVDFGAYFLDLNMNSFLHSVVVAWTDEASVTQPDGLIQAGNVTNTTLSSAISSETGDVLIITDANYKNYLTTYQGGIPSTLYAGDILTLDKPYSTVIFDTTASGHVAVVTGDANVLRNGRRVTILGNWAPQTNGGAAGAVSGRFSEYLYQYRAGFAGGGNSGVLQYVREEFLYYNGIWYSKGY